MIGDKEDLFEAVREAVAAQERAKIIAEKISEIEGQYYSCPTTTSSVLSRYFEYHTHKDIKDYWQSSNATC